MEEQTEEPNITQESQKPQLDEDVIKQFLAIQKQEIAVRQSEVTLRGKDIDNQRDIALRQIDAQASDLKDQREHKKQSSIITKLFVIGLIVIVIGLIIYLIEKGKDEIAFEILKVVGITIISFGGGFFYGKSRSNTNDASTIEH